MRLPAARQGAQVRLGEERLPAAQTSAQVRRPCEEATICNNICYGEIIKQSVRDPKTVDLEPLLEAEYSTDSMYRSQDCGSGTLLMNMISEQNPKATALNWPNIEVGNSSYGVCRSQDCGSQTLVEKYDRWQHFCYALQTSGLSSREATSCIQQCPGTPQMGASTSCTNGCPGTAFFVRSNSLSQNKILWSRKVSTQRLKTPRLWVLNSCTKMDVGHYFCTVLETSGLRFTWSYQLHPTVPRYTSDGSVYQLHKQVPRYGAFL